MQPSSKVREICYTFCPVVVTSHIAMAKGWFQEEFDRDGIKLSHISTLPLEHWQSHFSHKYQPLFRDGGNIPPIWTNAEGVKTKVVGMNFVDHSRSILVAKDSPITSVKDLKGKKIALKRRLRNLIDFPRVMEKRDIILALEAHGLSEDDIQFIDIPIDIGSIATDLKKNAEDQQISETAGWAIAPQADWKLPHQPEIEALGRGEVDALTANSGRDLILERAGAAKIIYDLKSYPDWRYLVNINYPYVVTVNADFADKYPELVVKWMRAMVKAGTWAKENRDEVLTIMADAIGRSEEVLNETLSEDFHMHLVPEITERGVEALNIMKDFMRKHGFINNDFSVEGWVDGSYLEEAKKSVQKC